MRLRDGEDKAQWPQPPSWPSAAPCWASLAWTPHLKVFSSFSGPYSLSFFYTGLSRPRDGFPSFQATAYLNDQDFFHYDSEDRKAIPSYPWSQMEGIEDWEKESELQKAREDIFMVTLKDIMDYYKDKEGERTEDCRGGGS